MRYLVAGFTFALSYAALVWWLGFIAGTVVVAGLVALRLCWARRAR
jgi:hypothetical protein